MFMIGLQLTVLLFVLSLRAARIVGATDDSTTAPYPITDNVLKLTVRRKGAWKPKLAPSQDYLYSIHQNHFYLANVIVGGQHLYLSVQTTSNSTWVASSNFVCLDPPCNIARSFDPTESTVQPSGPRARQYGRNGQFIEGTVIHDKLSFGGLNIEQMPYFTMTQPIVLADIGRWKGDGKSAGVLGLGYYRRHDPFSVLSTLFEEYNILPIVTLALNRYSESFPTAGGYLAFGGVPDIPLPTAWVRVPILEPTSETSAPRISLEGFFLRRPPGVEKPRYMFQTFSDYPATVEIASGIPEAFLPAEIVARAAEFYEPPGIFDPANNLYHMPCDAAAPIFGIKFKRRVYQISPQDLLDGAPEYGENSCKLQLRPASDGRLILGDVWLHNVILTFDYTQALQKAHEGEYGAVRIGRREY